MSHTLATASASASASASATAATTDLASYISTLRYRTTATGVIVIPATIPARVLPSATTTRVLGLAPIPTIVAPPNRGHVLFQAPAPPATPVIPVIPAPATRRRLFNGPDVPNREYHRCDIIHTHENLATYCPDCCARKLYIDAVEVRRYDQRLRSSCHFLKIWVKKLTKPKLKLILWIAGIQSVERVARNLFNSSDPTYRGLRCIFTNMQKSDLVIMLMHIFYYTWLPTQNTIPQRKFDFVIESNQHTSSFALFECPICIDLIQAKEKITLNCHHDLCYTCFNNYLGSIVTCNQKKKPCCSLCREPISNVICDNTFNKAELKTKFN